MYLKTETISGGLNSVRVPEKVAVRLLPDITADKIIKGQCLIICTSYAKAIRFISKTMREQLFLLWCVKAEDMIRKRMLQMYLVLMTEKRILISLPAKGFGMKQLSNTLNGWWYLPTESRNSLALKILMCLNTFCAQTP